MKKIFASILCLMVFVISSASANPFTVSAKPAAAWSLSDAMELVGEDVFAEMLTELKQNLIGSIGEDVGVGFTYSPRLYAVIDSLIAEDLDPHEAVYSIGDTSPDMNDCFAVLMNKGYIDEIPSSYTEEVANEVRKIQYAAGLPATGEITNALLNALLIDSVIPSNKETLSFLAPVSGMIADKCTQEMDAALYVNGLLSQNPRKNPNFSSDAAAAALSSYIQVREYLPSFVAQYQFHAPVIAALRTVDTSEIDEEAINIASNSSAILSVLFYYAQYDLRHDFTGYAVEYDELLKK